MSAYRWVVDLGNTRVKLGRFGEEGLLEVHTYLRTALDEALAWLLRQQSSGYAWLNTGAPAEAEKVKLQHRAHVWSYEPGTACPLTVRYATPKTLGVDRLAAAVGAYAMYPHVASLVIDAGTCLTYEYVSADGEYLGGNIAPGLHMRLHAMHEFTGKLPLVPRELPSVPRGFDTRSALQVGGLGGAVMELRGYMSAFRQNHPNGQILLCGGDAPFLRPLLPGALALRPHLVLEGLAKMHAYATDFSG